MLLEIQAFGFKDASGKLKKVSFRMRNARPAFELVNELLEQSEKRVFAKLGGKYVDTGALMDSLTQPNANEAIREAHMDGLDFGTSLWYARFHKDRRGRSPTLKLLPKERKLAAEAFMGYVTVGGMQVAV
jgi:hypothetical protein